MGNFKISNLEEMMKDFKNGVYDFTNNGECSKCGACCSDLLPVTDAEIKRIRQYVSDRDIKEHRTITPTANATIDLTCPFCDSGKELKCTIYPVRPMVCREFCCNKQCKHKKLMNKKFKLVSMRNIFFGK